MRLPPSAVHVPHHDVPCLTTTAPSTNLRVPKTPPLPALAPSRAAHAPCRGHRHVALWSARRPRGKRRAEAEAKRVRHGDAGGSEPRRRGGERQRPRRPSRGRSSSKSSRRRAASQRRRRSASQRDSAGGTRATFRRPPAAPLHPSTVSRGQAGRRRHCPPSLLGAGVLFVRGEVGGHSASDLFRHVMPEHPIS